MKWALRIKILPENWRLQLRRRYIDPGDEFEYQILEEDEASWHSRRLQERARVLRLPRLPVFEDGSLSVNYQRSGIDGHVYFLSLVGEQKVRAAIREEEKFRAEVNARRIPYITAITGLIGTVTGLVALLVK
jgi:hypothetical protein